jgi:DNA-binding CsgD family transcriptional regulator
MGRACLCICPAATLSYGSIMVLNGVDRLTEGQKDCLRLVLQLKQTKEIARELGISPDTVKQRIGIAMRALGADSRVQAARMLETHETAIYPRGVYTPPELVPAPHPASEELLTGDPDRKGRPDYIHSIEVKGPGTPPAAEPSPVSSLMEMRDALTLREMTANLVSRLLLGQDQSGAEAGNRLGATQRLLLILLIAFGSILSVTGLVAAVHQLALLRH